MAAELEQFASTPLAGMDYRFKTYLSEKKSWMSKHMVGNGIPDYAYKTDLEYRKKLDSIPGIYKIAKTMYSTYVNQQFQKLNMSGVAVGPQQMPEIYDIACDCAKKLGISVPHIYVSNDDDFNAYAYAVDDIEPFIVVTNNMLFRMSLSELKSIIGHECGHIQNNHVLYNFIAQDLINGSANIVGSIAATLLAKLQALLTTGVRLTFNMWSRAAEVTADRAAMICCDDVETCYRVNKKLMYGGVRVEDKIDTDFDLESLKEQLSLSTENVSRFYELEASHPLSIKRIFAEMEFAQCEVLYSWRPDLREANTITRSKEACDERCKRYIDVVRKGEKK